MVVKLREIRERESRQMAELIGQDRPLMEELGFNSEKQLTAKSIYSDIQAWQKSKSAVCYGIYHDNQITGMISLSHHNQKEKTARVGYWVGNDFRRKGIASKAFAAIIGKARTLGIERLSSKIDKTNYPSLSIWNKYKIKREEISKKQIKVELDFSINK